MDTTPHTLSLITSQFTSFSHWTHWTSHLFQSKVLSSFKHNMPTSKEYHQEYYKQHRTEIIARQMEYHRENREKYLAYMREYNRQYFRKHYVPRPKKVKEPKPPKPPKPPKEPKPPRKKREPHYYTPKEPVYPTRIEYGNFVLNFFD